MKAQTQQDLKRIKDTINMMNRPDRRNLMLTKVGENKSALLAAIVQIEELCSVIRQQENFPNAIDAQCR